MKGRFEPGDSVFTVRSDREPGDYQPGARDGNRWNASGVVLRVSDAHGLCYEVSHSGSIGWYEPYELVAEFRD